MRWLLLAVLVGCTSTPPRAEEHPAPPLATSPTCASERGLRSAGARPVVYRVVNDRSAEVTLYWLDPQGRRQRYATVPPRRSIAQPTFAGHAWVVTDARGGCLAVGVAGEGELRVEAGTPPGPPPATSRPGPPPAALGLAPFYRKYVDAGGIPVVGSARVEDRALVAGANVVEHMLRKRPDARQAIVAAKVRVAVMAATEQTLDIPEHADLATLPTDTPGMDWNQRARGLGATLVRPATSCGEENLLCARDDRYRGENILVHEFGHTIAQIGLAADAGFQSALLAAYRGAMARGLWRGTYAASNVHEYWAEGVQDWFDANLHDVFEHNHVHTRVQLARYDGALHALLAQVFVDDDWRFTCP